MNSFTTIGPHEQWLLIKALKLSGVDLLLLHIAYIALKVGGHRYGSFLDAATMAAKLVIYLSYLDCGQSLNKTGLLHHIEPKRVKEIVREMEDILAQENQHNGLGSQEPEFLIGIPNLWLAYYPASNPESLLAVEGLTSHEAADLIAQLPQNRPPAKIINEIQLFELLDAMHQIAHQQGAQGKQKPFSNALREHYLFKVLQSGMVVKLRQSLVDMDFYALIRMSYSPRQLSARLNTLFGDLVNTVELLQLWVNDAPHVLRALETLEIRPENQSLALAELDDFLRAWADKYHDETGISMMLQLVVGPHAPP